MIDFSQLDKTIHEKSRLAIMTLLAAQTSWPYQDLKSQFGMSSGGRFLRRARWSKPGC